MKRILLILLIVVPALEILTMIQVGKIIGGWLTFFLIIGLSALGVYLLSVQGRYTLQQIRNQMEMGMLPGEALLDGACILVGGILLVLPGFLSDALGLLLLIPFARAIPKLLIKAWLLRLIQRGNVTLYRRW
ncbi:FxsA family protein [Tumebacillus lipolyticus]|uniref:FxsA family protein n=1 Tax=Tumebacillus lipolyticus TaxID=1280370 RepID=A0ABW4ZV35_9BACL